MRISDYVDELESSSEIMKKIREIACCVEIMNEHINIMYDDIFLDLNIECDKELSIKEKAKLLRKKILADDILTLEKKYELINLF